LPAQVASVSKAEPSALHTSTRFRRGPHWRSPGVHTGSVSSSQKAVPPSSTQVLPGHWPTVSTAEPSALHCSMRFLSGLHWSAFGSQVFVSQAVVSPTTTAMSPTSREICAHVFIPSSRGTLHARPGPIGA
jgi:hypothetical protein